MEAVVIKKEDPFNLDEICIKEEPTEESTNFFDANKSLMVAIKMEDCVTVKSEPDQPFENVTDSATSIIKKHQTGPSESLKEQKLLTNDYTCKYCNKVYKSAQGCSDHEKTHNGEIPICKICKKSYATHSNLYQHMKVHTTVRFQCDICEEEFVYKQTLKKHILKAHLDQNYNNKVQCGVCKNSYIKSHYTRHFERVHLKYRQFDCNLCEKHFSERSFLNRHLALVHEVVNGGARFDCKVCNVPYFSMKDFDLHRKTHKGKFVETVQVDKKETTNIPFVSRTIVKKELIIDDPHYSNKKLVDNPMKSDGRPSKTSKAQYRCDICDKTHLSKWRLKDHLELHAFGYFECDLCDKKFSLKDSIKRHMLTNHVPSTNKKPSTKTKKSMKKRSAPAKVTIKPEEKVEAEKYFKEIAAKRQADKKRGRRRTMSTLPREKSEVDVEQYQEELENRYICCDKKFLSAQQLQDHFQQEHEVTEMIYVKNEPVIDDQ